MLFRKEVLDRVEHGKITLAFRKWNRPSVKQGGFLKTRIGLLSIDSVEVVKEDEITEAEAIEAGYDSVDKVLEELSERHEGEMYRIRFRMAGPDPRIELRQRGELTADEWQEVERRLNRLDKASRAGPWTTKVLELIDVNAGVRAGDLAPRVDQEKAKFKQNVRKLKNLGLTESLETGYRLSPRGRVVLERLKGGGEPVNRPIAN